MSGKLKEVRERMKSVQSTQQITKAMKMVSAAKLRKSQENIMKLRPYAAELRSVLEEVLASLHGDVSLPLLRVSPVVKSVLIISVCSDRGLCGAFNNNIVKLVDEHVQQHYVGANVRVWCIGKKALDPLARRGYQTQQDFLHIAHPISTDGIKACADQAMELFLKGEVDAIDVVYNEFKNVSLQKSVVSPFLPFVASVEKQEGVPLAHQKQSVYIFEQDPVRLLEYLIPMTLRTQLFKAVFDSIASEHGARMTSMDKATDNANEIFKQLKVSYNRARQAAITTEISEIVAGAASI